jgi:hypothetical protein
MRRNTVQSSNSCDTVPLLRLKRQRFRYEDLLQIFLQLLKRVAAKKLIPVPKD